MNKTINNGGHSDAQWHTSNAILLSITVLVITQSCSPAWSCSYACIGSLSHNFSVACFLPCVTSIYHIFFSPSFASLARSLLLATSPLLSRARYSSCALAHSLSHSPPPYSSARRPSSRNARGLVRYLKQLCRIKSRGFVIFCFQISENNTIFCPILRTSHRIFLPNSREIAQNSRYRIYSLKRLWSWLWRMCTGRFSSHFQGRRAPIRCKTIWMAKWTNADVWWTFFLKQHRNVATEIQNA